MVHAYNAYACLSASICTNACDYALTHRKL